jgi:hypothetical protein
MRNLTWSWKNWIWILKQRRRSPIEQTLGFP